MHEVLIARLGAERVSVGENFRFGQGAKGTEELLRSHSEFQTHVTPLVEVEGETVSSSQIRGLVAAGEVKDAMAFLGGPFLFEGEVMHGDKRGRELGMPTANLVPDDRFVCPGHGGTPPGPANTPRSQRRRSSHLRHGPRASGRKKGGT